VSTTTWAQPSFGRASRLWPGLTVTLRPIGPSDAGILQAYVRALSPEARYDRFLGALSELSPAELDRVIHLDQKHDLAQLAETWVDGAPTVIGEMRLALATNRLEGEFALSIADQWRGKGLGRLLIADIERWAESLGVRYLVGDVLRSNRAMKALARKMGFLLGEVPHDPRLVRVVKEVTFSQAVLPRDTLGASGPASIGGFFGGRPARDAVAVGI
jgi:GNAT superfamily N-acetyltransferase